MITRCLWGNALVVCFLASTFVHILSISLELFEIWVTGSTTSDILICWLLKVIQILFMFIIFKNIIRCCIWSKFPFHSNLRNAKAFSQVLYLFFLCLFSFLFYGNCRFNNTNSYYINDYDVLEEIVKEARYIFSQQRAWSWRSSPGKEGEDDEQQQVMQTATWGTVCW